MENKATDAEEESDFTKQHELVVSALDELVDLHEGVESELADSEAKVEELEKELEAREDEPHTGLALETLFRTADGRRLIERAYLADPKKTAMELRYLGADDIRGDLEVGAELAKRSIQPDPGPLFRRTPRA